MSLISEVAGDETPVCGIEIEVPSAQSLRCTQTVFFWAPAGAVGSVGYEEAALQAISFL